MSFTARDYQSELNLSNTWCKYHGPENLQRITSFLSTAAEKFWRPVAAVLEESGATPQQIKKIRYPFPRHGERGFRSIFHEMPEGGLISKEDYAAIYNRSLRTV